MSEEPGDGPQPTVFISYAHESDQLRTDVKALADWLAGRGCTVLTDHCYAYRPPEEGWTSWMHNCIARADAMLIVCTPKLRERYAKQAPPETGRGATFEGAIVTQHMYDASMRIAKFYPIQPDGGSYEDIPTTLRNWWNGHYFPSGYEGIRRLIFDEPGGVQQEEPSQVDTAHTGTGWSIDSRHEQITVQLLEADGARGFLELLQNQLAEEFQPDPRSSNAA